MNGGETKEVHSSNKLTIPWWEMEQAFINWLINSGAWISPKVSLHDYSKDGQGRGVIALDDIEANEVLFTIPRKIFLNEHTSSYNKLVSSKKASTSDWLPLMWIVALEKLSGSES